MTTQSWPDSLSSPDTAHSDQWPACTPAEVEVADTRWLDTLVGLHVLAEHGDPVSAEVADRWIATDGEAHKVWMSVEAALLHAGEQLSAAHPGGFARLRGR